MTTEVMELPLVDVPPTLSQTRANAGRVGARRVHELARLGKLYEKDHRLTPGRQRLKQLIQLGHKYEREHGIATKVKSKKRCRDPWGEFLIALARVVQPKHRKAIKQLVASLITQVNTNESETIQDQPKLT